MDSFLVFYDFIDKDIFVLLVTDNCNIYFSLFIFKVYFDEL